MTFLAETENSSNSGIDGETFDLAMYSSYRSLEIFSSFPRKGIQTLPEKSLYPSIERNITKFGTKTSKNCVSETTLLWQKNPKMTPFYRILDAAIKSPHP